MKRLFACLLATLFALPLLAHADPLYAPRQLSAKLAEPDLRIVDIRGGREANGKSPYDNGHIPGAVSAPYAAWRGPKDNPGKLLPASQLTQLVQQLGIDRDTPVVVVGEGSDNTEFGAAARVAWTLIAGGVKTVSILNGGMAAWREAGLPVNSDVPEPMPTAFELKFDPALLATRADVEAAVTAGNGAAKGVRLLDARPRSFYEGEDKHALSKQPGTIKGAASLDNAVWFKDGSAIMVDPAEATRIAAAHQLDLASPTVSFCNSGHWAATNWFVLHEVLGQKDVKLYPESLIEWSRADLPMDNVPGRLRQFWQQLRAALSN